MTRSIALLDAAAVAAVRQWRFRPARSADGTPVRVRMEIPVRFVLRLKETNAWTSRSSNCGMRPARSRAASSFSSPACRSSPARSPRRSGCDCGGPSAPPPRFSRPGDATTPSAAALAELLAHHPESPAAGLVARVRERSTARHPGGGRDPRSRGAPERDRDRQRSAARAVGHRHRRRRRRRSSGSSAPSSGSSTPSARWARAVAAASPTVSTGIAEALVTTRVRHHGRDPRGLGLQPPHASGSAASSSPRVRRRGARGTARGAPARPPRHRPAARRRDDGHDGRSRDRRGSAPRSTSRRSSTSSSCCW